MQILVCLMFVCVFMLDYVRRQLGLPQLLGLVPEMLSAVAMLMVLSGFARRGLRIAPVYLLVFVIFLLVVVAGLIIADATMGPLVGGLRFYGKYVPFLLLPMALNFSPAQIAVQVRLVLVLAALQFPVTFLQRFVIYAGGSGDLAQGTFTSGSQNAIVLISILACIVGCYFKRVVSGRLAVVLCTIMFLPSTMAEVKGAVFLLPLALFIPAFYVPRGERSGRVMLRIGVAAVIALAGYSLIYQLAESTRDGRTRGEHRTSIIEFVTDPEKIMTYLAPRLSGRENSRREGRVDGVAEPIITHRNDIPKLATGLGLGALSKSPFEALSADQHAHILEDSRALVTMSYLLWEVGVLGTLVICAGLILVWRDARYLSRASGFMGGLALGWLAVVPIYFLAMFWKNTLINNAVMYLFAYFSGLLMAEVFSRKFPSLNSLETRPGARPGADVPENEDGDNPNGLALPPLLNEARSSST